MMAVVGGLKTASNLALFMSIAAVVWYAVNEDITTSVNKQMLTNN